MTTRLFISAVTHEFLSCRTRLAQDLRLPDLIPEDQESIARLASGSSILLKLDDSIRDCHAVIHLIGQQTSFDGQAAIRDAVDDLLVRYLDLPDVSRLNMDELHRLSYTQWEAWLAYYHLKTTRPALKLIIATPTAAFGPDHPPEATTALAQQQSQAWHYDQLRKRAHFSEITFARAEELSIQILRALKDILPARLPAQNIAESRLINRHTAEDFIGRDLELALLDTAWAARDTVNVQCVIAWGGVGKTALLARWVQTRFRNHGWNNKQGQPDPVCYFDWTFYDQGTRADDATQAGAASVGTFFVEALRHFGDLQPELPERKAERLAARVQTHRSLLVLDGLEPLQYPHNHPQAGQVTDPDLAQLLRLLAQKNPGLCLVSSRERLSELHGQLAGNAPHHELEDLSTDAAIALLRKLNVTGSDADLARAAADYQHHALSLILLGRFLAAARGGDIRQRDTVSFKKADDKRSAHTRSAWHVLETYERWLQSPNGNLIDLQALRLIGLFDRPASPDCLSALRQAPAIAGVTDHLVELDRDDWNAVLQRLHQAHLIQLKFPARDPDSQAPYPEPASVLVDAHPLVREYFAKQLRDTETFGFEASHSRLFDHLRKSTPHRPDTLDGLRPLYQAVAHGCLAGRQQQACDVLFSRILRGEEGFSTKKLGAIGEDLAAVAAFFEAPWSRVSQNLGDPDKAWLFNEAAFRLRALGRLREAVEPIRLSGQMLVTAEAWAGAAISHSNLSQLELNLGQLQEAVTDAYRAVTFADRSGDVYQRITKRLAAADALHQSGELEEARALFTKAEVWQRQDQPAFEMLYSLQGFLYCDLILSAVERAAWQPVGMNGADQAQIKHDLNDAERRATYSLQIAEQNNWLLDIALAHLTLARVAIYLIASSEQPITRTNSHVTPALEGLRKAVTLNHLPRALLTAAHWHALIGDHTTARRYLEEAQHIAERGPMPLYLADVHLHRARLAAMVPANTRAEHWPGVDPKAELARARVLIEKHGYWRRREELADAEQAAANW